MHFSCLLKCYLLVCHLKAFSFQFCDDLDNSHCVAVLQMSPSPLPTPSSQPPSSSIPAGGALQSPIQPPWVPGTSGPLCFVRPPAPGMGCRQSCEPGAAPWDRQHGELGGPPGTWGAARRLQPAAPGSHTLSLLFPVLTFSSWKVILY